MKDKNFEQDRHYDDLEGNIRTFTVKDYSKKTKVYKTTKVDHDKILKKAREELIKEILALNPQTAVPDHETYVIRDTTAGKFKWDELSLKDKGIPIENLIMHKNLFTNRQQTYLKTY